MKRHIGPDLDTVKWEHIGRLSEAGMGHIAGGFRSDALGEPHIYPSAMEARQQLADEAIEALQAGPEWSTAIACTTPAHQDDLTWPEVAHTAQQVLQVQAAGKAHLKQQRRILRELIAQVNAATNEADVLAITWP